MQPQQQERLKRMIHSSAILTPQEKEEWLSLLIVMNDKQVSELEAILNTPEEPKPASAPVPIIPPAQTASQPARQPVAQAPVSQPPLSHISNLPSSISQARYPLPKMVKPNPNTLKQWEDKLRRTVQEKELSRPAEEKLLSQSSVKPIPGAPRVAPPERAMHKVATAAPMHAPSSRPRPHEPVVEIKDAASVANLNLATMRAMGAKLVPVLKQVVAGSNYFEVLFYLEKSPLYKSYLDTGHEALNTAGSGFPAASGDKILLSKEEFEAFSDLLKSIQIS